MGKLFTNVPETPHIHLPNCTWPAPKHLQHLPSKLNRHLPRPTKSLAAQMSARSQTINFNFNLFSFFIFNFFLYISKNFNYISSFYNYFTKKFISFTFYFTKIIFITIYFIFIILNFLFILKFLSKKYF